MMKLLPILDQMAEGTVNVPGRLDIERGIYVIFDFDKEHESSFTEFNIAFEISTVRPTVRLPRLSR